MIFPEALESAEEFAAFARAVPVAAVANMTEFGRGPLLDFDELARIGYRAVLYPLTAFRAAMKAAERTLTALRERRHATRRARSDAIAGRAVRPARLRRLGGARPGVFRRDRPGR